MTALFDRLVAGGALWALLAVTVATAPAGAQQTPPVPPAPVAEKTVPAAAATAEEPADDPEALRDPEALAELKRATDFLTAMPRLHLKASVVYDVVQEDGRRLQFEKHGDVYLQRPDRLYAEVVLDDGRHRKFWYDGKTLAFAELSRNLHTQMQAPPTIDGMLDMLEGLFKDPMPLSDLLYSDLNPVAERAFEADIVGDSLVNGVPCTHLTFRGETVDWQLWVEQGDKPLIRKLAISYREEPGTPQAVAIISQWETPEKFGDELFTFVAPKGSERISVLVPMPRPAASK